MLLQWPRLSRRPANIHQCRVTRPKPLLFQFLVAAVTGLPVLVDIKPDHPPSSTQSQAQHASQRCRISARFPVRVAPSEAFSSAESACSTHALCDRIRLSGRSGLHSGTRFAHVRPRLPLHFPASVVIAQLRRLSTSASYCSSSPLSEPRAAINIPTALKV